MDAPSGLYHWTKPELHKACGRAYNAYALTAEAGGLQRQPSLSQQSLDEGLPAADALGHDARMVFCPRCQGPIPNDAERTTGNTVYCPHCDALLVQSGNEWVEVEPTP